MKVIDISRKSVSKKTLDYLLDNATEYKDQNLSEHLVNVISQVESDNDKHSDVKHSKAVKSEMDALVKLCNENDAAYVRFVD